MSLLDEFIAPLALPGARYVGIAGALIADEDIEVRTFGISGDAQRHISANAIFEVASLTKTFTGLLLCELASKGEVSLNDRAVDFLPEALFFTDAGWKEIQLGHLASHTSGLPRLSPDWNQDEQFDSKDPYSHVGEEELLYSISITPLHATPGETYHYSNFGFGVLGYILGRVDGRGFESVLSERVLRPLGMDDTAISLSKDQVSRFLPGHHGHRYEVPHWNFAFMAGAGGLRSTIGDVSRYVRANLFPSRTPLEGAFQMQRSPRARVNAEDWFVGEDEHISLDWRLSSRGGRDYVWHNGSSAGFGAFACFVPKSKVGVVLLANSSRADTLTNAGVSILESLIQVGHDRSGSTMESP